MTGYAITFLIMLAVFMVGCFAFKLPVGVSMLLSALCGAIEGGLGTETIRMMVEGEFGYVDTILTIGTAMVFMKVIEDSGALDALSSLVIEKFHKVPAVLLILIMLIIMFPGMITGSSTAAVLSAGSIMAPVLALMGIDAVTSGSIIAMGALLGMIAPPVNAAALIICAGADVPYVGFTGPLALITFPLAVLFVLLLGYKQAKGLDYEALKPALVKQDETRKQYGVKIYLPLLVLLILMIVFKVLKLGEDIGMPLMFLLSAFTGFFTGRKINILETIPAAIRTAAPVMGILMGVGMFIEVMTATGVRGFRCGVLLRRLLRAGCALRIHLYFSPGRKLHLCPGCHIPHRFSRRHDASDGAGGSVRGPGGRCEGLHEDPEKMHCPHRHSSGLGLLLPGKVEDDRRTVLRERRRITI